jgi:hypothetical protein
MTKARILANLISDNAELADGQISVAEVVGAAPLASPSFTGNLTTGGNITLDEASASAHGEATKLLTASGNGYYQDLRISANDYDFRYGPSAWNSAYSALQISSTGSVVFNEGGLDADTRFEGTSDSNVLAINAGNNRVGVGTNGGLHKLSVLHTGTALGGVAHFSIGSAASAYATTVFRVDDVDNNFAIDQNYASQDRNRLFIKRSNGYVGIGGVTSPNAMLHVESNASGNYAAIVNHTQATNPNGLWINYSSSGYIDTYAFRIQNTDGVIWDQRGTGSLNHYAQDGATVRFNTGAANVDFQVKSDFQSNAFFVDASTGEINTNTYGFNIYNYDDGPNLNITSARDYNSLMMGAAANYGSNNSSENKWSWNWRGRGAASSQHYNFLYDDIGNKEMFRVQADASQYAVVVNDGGHDHDFRVEADSNTHALFVDAGYNSGKGAAIVGSSSAPTTGVDYNIAASMLKYSDAQPIMATGAAWHFPSVPSNRQAQANRWKFQGFTLPYHGAVAYRADASYAQFVIELPNGGPSGKSNLEIFEIGFNRGWSGGFYMVEVYESYYVNGGYKKYLFHGGYDPSFTLYENYGNNSISLNVLSEGPFQDGTSSVSSSATDASYYRKTVRASYGAYFGGLIVLTVPSWYELTLNNAEVDNGGKIRLLNPQ